MYRQDDFFLESLVKRFLTCRYGPKWRHGWVRGLDKAVEKIVPVRLGACQEACSLHSAVHLCGSFPPLPGGISDHTKSKLYFWNYATSIRTSSPSHIVISVISLYICAFSILIHTSLYQWQLHLFPLHINSAVHTLNLFVWVKYLDIIIVPFQFIFSFKGAVSEKVCSPSMCVPASFYFTPA